MKAIENLFDSLNRIEMGLGSVCVLVGKFDFGRCLVTRDAVSKVKKDGFTVLVDKLSREMLSLPVRTKLSVAYFVQLLNIGIDERRASERCTDDLGVLFVKIGEAVEFFLLFFKSNGL